MGNGYIAHLSFIFITGFWSGFYDLLTAYENELGRLYRKDNVFRLAGKVNIPAGKRDEMNSTLCRMK